ncbi:unnamed protein product [Gongylonema pulchrum]|uniref:Chromo domain-containing protein n=1 Tax=Gongylonema pulchrum TaxID=637853 RepID=A0A183DNM9_9BILA|nr:unnamed protein product [Gongylonema pulchrum]
MSSRVDIKSDRAKESENFVEDDAPISYTVNWKKTASADDQAWEIKKKLGIDYLTTKDDYKSISEQAATRQSEESMLAITQATKLGSKPAIMPESNSFTEVLSANKVPEWSISKTTFSNIKRKNEQVEQQVRSTEKMQTDISRSGRSDRTPTNLWNPLTEATQPELFTSAPLPGTTASDQGHGLIQHFSQRSNGASQERPAENKRSTVKTKTSEESIRSALTISTEPNRSIYDIINTEEVGHHLEVSLAPQITNTLKNSLSPLTTFASKGSEPTTLSGSVDINLEQQPLGIMQQPTLSLPTSTDVMSKESSQPILNSHPDDQESTKNITGTMPPQSLMLSDEKKETVSLSTQNINSKTIQGKTARRSSGNEQDTITPAAPWTFMDIGPPKRWNAPTKTPAATEAVSMRSTKAATHFTTLPQITAVKKNSKNESATDPAMRQKYERSRTKAKHLESKATENESSMSPTSVNSRIPILSSTELLYNSQGDKAISSFTLQLKSINTHQKFSKTVSINTRTTELTEPPETRIHPESNVSANVLTSTSSITAAVASNSQLSMEQMKTGSTINQTMVTLPTKPSEVSSSQSTTNSDNCNQTDLLASEMIQSKMPSEQINPIVHNPEMSREQTSLAQSKGLAIDPQNDSTIAAMGEIPSHLKLPRLTTEKTIKLATTLNLGTHAIMNFFTTINSKSLHFQGSKKTGITDWNAVNGTTKKRAATADMELALLGQARSLERTTSTIAPRSHSSTSKPPLYKSEAGSAHKSLSNHEFAKTAKTHPSTVREKPLKRNAVGTSPLPSVPAAQRTIRQTDVVNTVTPRVQSLRKTDITRKAKQRARKDTRSSEESTSAIAISPSAMETMLRNSSAIRKPSDTLFTETTQTNPFTMTDLSAIVATRQQQQQQQQLKAHINLLIPNETLQAAKKNVLEMPLTEVRNASPQLNVMDSRRNKNDLIASKTMSGMSPATNIMLSTVSSVSSAGAYLFTAITGEKFITQTHGQSVFMKTALGSGQSTESPTLGMRTTLIPINVPEESAEPTSQTSSPKVSLTMNARTLALDRTSTSAPESSKYFTSRPSLTNVLPVTTASTENATFLTKSWLASSTNSGMTTTTNLEAVPPSYAPHRVKSTLQLYSETSSKQGAKSTTVPQRAAKRTSLAQNSGGKTNKITAFPPRIASTTLSTTPQSRTNAIALKHDATVTKAVIGTHIQVTDLKKTATSSIFPPDLDSTAVTRRRESPVQSITDEAAAVAQNSTQTNTTASKNLFLNVHLASGTISPSATHPGTQRESPKTMHPEQPMFLQESQSTNPVITQIPLNAATLSASNQLKSKAKTAKNKSYNSFANEPPISTTPEKANY